MSEASRAAALAHAATVHYGSGDAEGTLATAELFHAFVSGDAAATSPAAGKKAPAATTAGKKAPAATGKKAPPPADDDAAEEEAAEETGDGPTKEEVGEAIEALLNANLRDKVIKLYAKFKAKSLSSVKPEDYAAIKEAAEDMLLNS
jgi:hypothetical protein